MTRLSLLFSLIIMASHSIFSQEVNGVIVSDSANLTVVKVWGSHEERGFACGYLLGDKISDLVANYMRPAFGSYMEAARETVINGIDLSIDQIYIDEAIALINGMNAAGTNYENIDYIDGLVFNAFLDIVKILGLSDMGPGCSSLMNWGDATLGTELDGKSVISRHLDWSADQTLINNQVMVVHIPSEENEQPWVMVGFAGQMSVLSGFNQNLAVFQHMMSDFYGSSSQGSGFEPIWLTMRKAIEKSDFNDDGINNTQDLRDAINSNPMGYADGYIITALAPYSMGYDSLTALVAEVAPQAPLITFRSKSYPDDIPGDNLYAANFEIKRNNHNHYCTRYYAVMNALGDGLKIGAEENWQIMRDHSNGSTGNLQFMQFIPENDIFKISVYRNGSPAYQLPAVTFSVSNLLQFPVGLNSNNANEEIQIFPNPAKDQLTVLHASNCIGKRYTLFSSNGKVVFESIINEKITTIHLKDLANGLYIFKIESTNGIKLIISSK